MQNIEEMYEKYSKIIYKYIFCLTKNRELSEEIVQDTEYIVKVGDTLWDLAKNFYGSSSKYNIIYEANKENIEETAKKRGLNTSKSGYWIFPGQKLMIPNIEKG